MENWRALIAQVDLLAGKLEGVAAAMDLADGVVLTSVDGDTPEVLRAAARVLRSVVEAAVKLQ